MAADTGWAVSVQKLNRVRRHSSQTLRIYVLIELIADIDFL